MKSNLGLGQLDHINWMIILSVITLSGAYSTASCKSFTESLFRKTLKESECENYGGWDRVSHQVFWVDCKLITITNIGTT